MGGQAFDTDKRLNGFMFHAYECKIFGVDDTGELGKHLWVPDAKAPPPKWLIDSIRLEGVKDPIEIQKIGEHPFVVDGRTREKAVRWLKDNEGLDILIPAILAKKGSNQAEIMASVVSRNVNRKTMTPYQIMQQLAYFVKFNGDDEESMKLLRVATQLDQRRIDKLLGVRENQPVLDALKAGDVDIEGAIALSEMKTGEDVKEKIAELKAEAKASGKKGGKITAEAARAAKVGKQKKPPSRKVERTVKLLEAQGATGDMLTIIRFLAGICGLEKTPPEFRDAYKAVMKGEDKKMIAEMKKEAKAEAKAAKKKGGKGK